MIQFLLDQNRSKIASYVLKNSGGKDDAEAILVEGVTNLILNVRKGQFKGESSLGTYLFAICKGLWLKTLRKEKRYTDLGDDKPLAIDENSPLTHFSESELQREVGFLLGKIGAACQEVLKLWAQHYSMTEIATQMEYKNAQISMNKKNKCLGKLKEIVRENQKYREQLQSFLLN
ncbi:MAG: hypothetical protein Crog4KO_05660 [Crocinitomicaceae bacterium]